MAGEVGEPPGGKTPGANAAQESASASKPGAEDSSESKSAFETLFSEEQSALKLGTTPAQIDQLRIMRNPNAGTFAIDAFNLAFEQRTLRTLSGAGWDRIARIALSPESGQALMESLGEVFGVEKSLFERLGELVGLDPDVKVEELDGKSVDVPVNGDSITLIAGLLAAGDALEIDYEGYDFRTLRIGLDEEGAATEIRTRGFDGLSMLVLAQMVGIDLPAEIDSDLSHIDTRALVSGLAAEHRERREAEDHLAAEMARAAAPDTPGLPRWTGPGDDDAERTFVLQGAIAGGDLSSTIASSGFEPCFCLAMVDRDSGRQAMAHIDTLVLRDDVTRLIRSFGAGENTEITLVPGPATEAADMVNVYLALQDSGLADQTTLADSLAVRQERGTALVLHDGALYRTDKPVIYWPFSGQFIH